MPRRFGPLRLVSCLLALLALAGMMGRGWSPVAAKGGPDLALIAALGGTLCHDGAAGTGSPDQPMPSGGMDCLLCPVCAPVGQSAVQPEPAQVVLAAEPLPRAAWASPGRPRAPPAVALIAARPRGPPFLI